MLFLALRLQAVTHASIKVPSVPTAQDVSAQKQFKMAPSSSDARLLFSLWPVATAANVQHLQKAKRASWQRVIRGTTAIKIPLVKGGSEPHNLTPVNIQSR